MKKTFYLFLIAVCAFVLGVTRVDAQHITSHVVNNPADSDCTPPYISLQTDSFITGMSVKTYFGDGTNTTTPLSNVGGIGSASISYDIGMPGVYSIKHVLIVGGVSVDSTVYSYNSDYCRIFPFGFYYDANANCIYDSGDARIVVPAVIEIDSNGYAVDTVTQTNSFYYSYLGPVGTIYTFKVLSLPPAFTLSCPAPAIIYDTIFTYSNTYTKKYFSLSCSSAPGFDLSVFVHNRAGTHQFQSSVLVTNNLCTPTPSTLTMTFSPKYNFHDAYPPPTSISGTIITWDFPALSAYNPKNVYVNLETGGALPSLAFGDTTHSSYVLTPTTGDINPANNSIIVIDTVTSSFDPNEKTVTPEGNILSGTQLEYTVTFENTGNDTAFNIHIQDTLSQYLDETSLQVTHSSAPVTTTVIKKSPLISGSDYYVVKFDFPGINLLDSSHHGQCDGLVTYTINTLSGLPNGTHIDNRAGIYFDYNSVVMTNTTTNIIGFPSGINTMSNVTKTQVYPNPVNDELTINTGNALYSTITITNITGQVVHTQNCTAATNKVNVKALPVGVYILTLRGESGISVQRFEKM